MADVAQLVEHQIVALRVAGSRPVVRPTHLYDHLALILDDIRLCVQFFVYDSFSLYMILLDSSDLISGCKVLVNDFLKRIPHSTKSKLLVYSHIQKLKA